MIDTTPNPWTKSDWDAARGIDPALLYCVFAGVDNFVFQHRHLCVRITEGLRTTSRQRDLLRLGKSKTLKSKHLEGQAIDLAILSADRTRAIWDLPYYSVLNGYIQERSLAIGVPITWGGDWKMRDGVHWELS